MRRAAAPSPRPKLRTMKEAMTAPPLSARKGTTLCRSMGSSSDGGPGSMSTQPFAPTGTAQPGAVPTALGKAVAPSGSRACLRWLDDMGRLPKYSRRRARLSASSSNGTFATRATVSLVRSSSVGPSPPVVITTSARPRASRRAASRRGPLSPRVCTCKRSTPRAESSRATWAASALTVCPKRSSVPTEMISARIVCSTKVACRRRTRFAKRFRQPHGRAPAPCRQLRAV